MREFLLLFIPVMMSWALHNETREQSENFDRPTILSITSTFKKELTVVFDPGEASNDNYTVKVEEKLQEVVLCEEKDIVCKGNCTCTNTIPTKYNVPDMPRDGNVTIIVIRERASRSNERRRTVNLLQHIKPEPVDEMDIENVDSTSASLALCAPFRQNSQFVIPRLHLFKSYLRLLVTVVKTQGYYEERKFNITLKKRKVCLRIGLSQLSPFTRYNVSVIASGGGGKSLPSSTYFTTLETAPLSSPEDIVYWMVPEKSANRDHGSIQQDSSMSQQTYSININWRPIPYDKKGGSISYSVYVSYKHDKNETNFNETTNKAYIILSKIPDTPVTLNIYSKNKMGLSKSSSSIRIPKGSVHADIDIPSHVETAGNLADIYLGKPSSSIEISAIYWCPGKQYPLFPEQVECLEYPEIVFDRADFEDMNNMLYANVSLKKESCHVEAVSELKQEEFFFYNDLENNQSRMSRIVNTSRVFANESNLCPSSSPNDDLIKDQEQHKFMFSVKGSHQLFPFKCYYDKDKDSVDLKFTQLKNEDSITLTWRQYCNFSPHQFLVKEYQVYSSQSDSCSNSNGKFKVVKNKIIKHSEFKVSPADGYACVESRKSPFFVSKANPLKLDDLSAGGDDDGVSVHTVVIILIALVIIITVGSCLFCIRQRKIKSRQALLFPMERANKDLNYQKTTDMNQIENSDDDSCLDSPPDYAVLNVDESATSSDSKFVKGSGENQSDAEYGYFGSDKDTGENSNSSETSVHSILKVESGIHSNEDSPDFSAPDIGSHSSEGSNDISEQRRQMIERKLKQFMSDSDG